MNPELSADENGRENLPDYLAKFAQLKSNLEIWEVSTIRNWDQENITNTLIKLKIKPKVSLKALFR
jgi:hypothetical protein